MAVHSAGGERTGEMTWTRAFVTWTGEDTGERSLKSTQIQIQTQTQEREMDLCRG